MHDKTKKAFSKIWQIWDSVCIWCGMCSAFGHSILQSLFRWPYCIVLFWLQDVGHGVHARHWAIGAAHLDAEQGKTPDPHVQCNIPGRNTNGCFKVTAPESCYVFWMRKSFGQVLFDLAFWVKFMKFQSISHWAQI